MAAKTKHGFFERETTLTQISNNEDYPKVK